MDGEINVVFWIKFSACLIVFAILPVWAFNIANLTLVYKLLFTLAGAVGVFIALQGKSMRANKYN